ncbi:autotransporter outer membrane beta-barrel domain-containing protein [Ursidibacter sp. B-7004-1]
MNTSKLSLAAKIVATTLLSLQTQSLYANPITTTNSCGDGCTSQITEDITAKTVKVIVSANDKDKVYTSEFYSPNNSQFEHFDIVNSAHIENGILRLWHTHEGTKSIKVENNGMLKGRTNEFGPNPETTLVSEYFELKNNGIIDIAGGTYSGISISSMLGNATYYIENKGKMINHGSTNVMFTRAKSATFKNSGVIDGSAYIISGSDVEYMFIENRGEILGHLHQDGKGTFHLKSLAGKLDGQIELYTDNVIIELENTDISKLHAILLWGNSPLKKSHIQINQEVKTGGDFGYSTRPKDYLDVTEFDKFTIKEKGKVILVGGFAGIEHRLLYSHGLGVKNGNLLTNNGTLSLDPTISSVDVKFNQTVNNNLIDLTEGSSDPAQTLTLYGDYVGGENSKLRVDSKWNNPDVQENDQLIIKGKASGTTKVEVKDVIAGDVIRSSVEKNGGWSKPIVIVEQGDEGKVVFTGTANTQGAEEAQLARRENGSATEYTWVLNAQVAPVMPQPATPVVPQPSPVQPSPAVPQPNQPVQPSPAVPQPNQPVQPPPVVPQPNSAMPQTTAPSIYAKTVSGYVQTNFINREIGLAQLGRLHERVGEQQLQNAGKSERSLNSWGRTRFTEGTLQGKNRFGVDSHQGLVQVGQDVAIKEFASGYAHQGLMFSHSWANNQFYDKYRAENGVITAEKGVGKGKTKAFSLGAYHTYYANDNSYLDFVANLSWLENKYFSTQTARQSGFGAGVSVEVGRSYSLSPQWRIEPQVQLKALYLTLGSVNDGVRKVKADDSLSVQGRLGARVTNGQFYVSANLVQDLTPAKTTVKIGQSSVTERYNATQFDVALGANVTLNKAQTLALYGEAKYSRALGGSNKVFSHRNGRENYTAQVGVRFQW